MKKKLMMGLALVAALSFVSCKSSESEYKKAYEKAKAQEMARTTTTDQVETAPVTVTPVVTTTPVTTTPVANTENDRQERLTVMNGGTLKAFNVVCGSFSSVDNANNLRNTLVSNGSESRDRHVSCHRRFIRRPRYSSPVSRPASWHLPRCLVALQNLLNRPFGQIKTKGSPFTQWASFLLFNCQFNTHNEMKNSEMN